MNSPSPPSSPTSLALPWSGRGLDRQLAGGLAGFLGLVVALGSVVWVLTGSLALVAGMMAFYVVVGSLYLIGAWSSTRWLSRVCAAAARALEAGRLVEARTLLDDNLVRSAANTPMYAIAIWLRARVALREGEFEFARDRLAMLLDWHWYAPGGRLHAHAAQVRAHLVLCLALAGRLDDAEREREREPRRERGEATLEIAERGRARNRLWLLADVVLLARRERFAELLDRLDQSAEVIPELPRCDRQSLALLHAWASFRQARDEPGFRAPHASLDPPDSLRSSNLSDPAGSRQNYDEAIETLTSAWPELRDFVASRAPRRAGVQGRLG